MTSHCDQRCKHCYLWNSPDVYQREVSHELPLAGCIGLIDSVFELCKVAGARPMFYLTGGDPLARPDFFKILSYLHKKSVPVQMMGNAHGLSDEIIGLLKCHGVKSYQLSLDGMKNKHDWCRGKGSFKKTVDAIKLLKKNDMPVVIMFTLTQENACDLAAVFELCCKLEVTKFAFARFSPQVEPDSKRQAHTEINPHSYRKLLDTLYNKEQQAHERGYRTILSKKDNLWNLYYYERGLWTPPDNPDNKIHSGCHIGRASLTVLSDGTVYACRRFESPIGKFPEQSALAIFTSDSLQEYRNINKFTKCSSCSLLYFCRGCPAISFYKTGNFYGADPQCWKN
ncbi:MAG: radical SAM protein [Candidatus Kuenenia sp.]|nr:radical SAM protein [Candidatus Kuenenia sp.]MCR4343026.1 radical SAM protein [Patescibacteria group bacterium]